MPRDHLSANLGIIYRPVQLFHVSVFVVSGVSLSFCVSNTDPTVLCVPTPCVCLLVCLSVCLSQCVNFSVPVFFCVYCHSCSVCLVIYRSLSLTKAASEAQIVSLVIEHIHSNVYFMQSVVLLVSSHRSAFIAVLDTDMSFLLCTKTITCVEFCLLGALYMFIPSV